MTLPSRPPELTFTGSNYSTAQTVTVSAAEDGDVLDDSDLITLSASGGITAPDRRQGRHRRRRRCRPGSVAGRFPESAPAHPGTPSYENHPAGGLSVGYRLTTQPAEKRHRDGEQLGPRFAEHCSRRCEPHLHPLHLEPAVSADAQNRPGQHFRGSQRHGDPDGIRRRRL